MHRRAFSVLIALAAVGCGSGIQVDIAYDKKASFAKLQTFAMVLPNKAVPVSGNVDPFKMLRMRQLTYGRMIARGFHAAPKESADFLVGVHAGVQNEIDNADVYDSGYLYGAGYPSADIPYKEGTLVIEFIDGKQKTVVWHGRGSSEVTSETTDERIAEIIDAILSYYPPGSTPTKD